MTNDKTAPQTGSLPELPTTPSGSCASEGQLTVEVDIEQDGDHRPSLSSPSLSDVPSSPPLSDSLEKDLPQSSPGASDGAGPPRMYECLSDEEIEENYLGNIPTHRRRHGVVNCPSPISSDGIDSGQTSPEELEQCQDEDEGPAYGLRRSKLAKPNGARRNPDGVYPKRVRMSVDEPPSRAREARRGSRGSTGSNDTLDSKSSSFSNSVAAHVRKDSIAIGIDKMNGFPFRQKSLLSFMKIPLQKKVKHFRSDSNEEPPEGFLCMHFNIHLDELVDFVNGSKLKLSFSTGGTSILHPLPNSLSTGCSSVSHPPSNSLSTRGTSFTHPPSNSLSTGASADCGARWWLASVRAYFCFIS